MRAPPRRSALRRTPIVSGAGGIRAGITAVGVVPAQVVPTEAVLQRAWATVPPSWLNDAEGGAWRVLFAGTWNHGPGPDFRDALLLPPRGRLHARAQRLADRNGGREGTDAAAYRALLVSLGRSGNEAVFAALVARLLWASIAADVARGDLAAVGRRLQGAAGGPLPAQAGGTEFLAASGLKDAGSGGGEEVERQRGIGRAPVEGGRADHGGVVRAERQRRPAHGYGAALL